MPKMNKTKYALLGMLSIRPMSGYDIKKFIETSIGYFWNESYGQIYPILKQLVDQGLATKHVEHQDSRPDRKVYTISTDGMDVLRSWLKETPEQPPPRDEMTLKLFFGYQNTPEISIDHLKQEIDKIEQNVNFFLDVEERLRDELDDKSELTFALSTLQLSKKLQQAKADWCRETIVQLEELSAPEELLAQDHSRTPETPNGGS